MENDLLVTSQSVIASGWIEIGLCWWPIALLMRLQFVAVLTMALVYERWMTRTKWSAVGEGGYEWKRSRIEMVYVLHSDNSSGELNFLFGKNLRLSSLICWILVRLLWILQWLDDF